MEPRRGERSASTDLEAKPCVLLVEDEPLLKKLVGGLLEEAGYEHVTIADHDQIAAAIKRYHPQCVILDSEPPAKGRGRSWEDAAAIRRAHPELPVLMFTADPDSMAEARAKRTSRSRAADYSGVIDKPFLVLEFLATLKHAVDTPLPSTPNGNGLATEALTVFPDLRRTSGLARISSALRSTSCARHSPRSSAKPSWPGASSRRIPHAPVRRWITCFSRPPA